MSEILTKTELELYFGKTFAADEREDRIRKAVNELVDTFCNRIIVGATYAEKHTVMESNRRTLIVRQPPIRTLTSIQSGRTSLTTVDANSYVIESVDAGIILWVTGFLTLGVHQYTVNYNGGFSPVPEDLKETAASIISRRIQKYALGRHGFRGKAFAQGNVELLQLDLEPEERVTLERYRLIRFDN